jgi:hypothetical protein
MSRRNVTHGTAIEDIFGYPTGTRYGREVYVAGQLARDSDGNQIASTALSEKFARAVEALRGWKMYETGWTKLCWPDAPITGVLSWAYSADTSGSCRSTPVGSST